MQQAQALRATLLAAQQPTQPGRKFLGCEGLHQVVVGAGVQALDAVGQPVARGQQQGRRLLAGAAQLAQPGAAGAVGQLPVQQPGVEGLAQQRRAGGREVAAPVPRHAPLQRGSRAGLRPGWDRLQAAAASWPATLARRHFSLASAMRRAIAAHAPPCLQPPPPRRRTRHRSAAGAGLGRQRPGPGVGPRLFGRRHRLCGPRGVLVARPAARRPAHAVDRRLAGPGHRRLATGARPARPVAPRAPPGIAGRPAAAGRGAGAEGAEPHQLPLEPGGLWRHGALGVALGLDAARRRAGPLLPVRTHGRGGRVRAVRVDLGAARPGAWWR